MVSSMMLHTGLTIFVEPLPVMELSNQIRIKEAEIESEIERILLVLTESSVLMLMQTQR